MRFWTVLVMTSCLVALQLCRGSGVRGAQQCCWSVPWCSVVVWSVICTWYWSPAAARLYPAQHQLVLWTGHLCWPRLQTAYEWYYAAVFRQAGTCRQDDWPSCSLGLYPKAMYMLLSSLYVFVDHTSESFQKEAEHLVRRSCKFRRLSAGMIRIRLLVCAVI